MALQSAVDCEICQRLAFEFARLQDIHTETLDNLQANANRVRRDEYRRLKILESDARLELEISRAELSRHKQIHL